MSYPPISGQFLSKQQCQAYGNDFLRTILFLYPFWELKRFIQQIYSQCSHSWYLSSFAGGRRFAFFNDPFFCKFQLLGTVAYNYLLQCICCNKKLKATVLKVETYKAPCICKNKIIRYVYNDVTNVVDFGSILEIAYIVFLSANFFPIHSKWINIST